MDWSKLKNKSFVTKNQKASQVVLQPNQSISEEDEVKQSLLLACEKSCLVKNEERKRGDSSRRVRWKDDYGNVLVQVKIYQPDVDVYDDSSDDDVDFTDFCNCCIM